MARGAIFGFAVVGCGGGGAEPDRSPPQISSPQKLDFYGGEMRVSAQVTDRSGVEDVWATVEGPEGTQVVELSKGEDDTWEGTVKLGANLGSQPVEYKVFLRARDKAGNETPEPGSR